MFATSSTLARRRSSEVGRCWAMNCFSISACDAPCSRASLAHVSAQVDDRFSRPRLPGVDLFLKRPGAMPASACGHDLLARRVYSGSGSVPTVLRWGSYRAFFYSNEGSEPAHVHVRSADKEAKFWLHDLTVAANSGFAAHEVSDILRHNETTSRSASGGLE